MSPLFGINIKRSNRLRKCGQAARCVKSKLREKAQTAAETSLKRSHERNKAGRKVKRTLKKC